MFSSIVGHQRAIDALQSAIRSGRLAGAYLFVGPNGIGKGTLAREFVKACNCLNSPDDACDTCYNCRLVEKKKFPDLYEVESRNGRILKVSISDDSENGLDKVLPRLHYPPIVGRQKFVWLEPADGLTDEAANMLLKTLEEPPSKTTFLLFSSREHAILPTVISRCQRIRLSPLSAQEVKRVLARNHPDVAGESLEIAALAAEGSVGEGATLLTEEALAERGKIVSVVLGGADSSLADRYGLVEKFLEGKKETGRDRLLQFYRVACSLGHEMLHEAAGSNGMASLFPGHSQEISRLAARLGVPGTLKYHDLLREFKISMIHNEHPRVLLVWFLGQICGLTGVGKKVKT